VTRNNKVLAFNAADARLRKTQAEIAVVEAQLADVKTEIAKSTDPGLAYAESFMNRATRSAKERVINLLYQWNRQLSYYSLADYDFSITTFSVDALRNTHAELSQRYTQARELLGGNRGRSIRDLEIEVTDQIPISEWQKFIQIGLATFAIPLDHSALRQLR
jgi:hypothetical protein